MSYISLKDLIECYFNKQRYATVDYVDQKLAG